MRELLKTIDPSSLIIGELVGKGSTHPRFPRRLVGIGVLSGGSEPYINLGTSEQLQSFAERHHGVNRALRESIGRRAAFIDFIGSVVKFPGDVYLEDLLGETTRPNLDDRRNGTKISVSAIARVAIEDLQFRFFRNAFQGEKEFVEGPGIILDAVGSKTLIDDNSKAIWAPAELACGNLWEITRVPNFWWDLYREDFDSAAAS